MSEFAEPRVRALIGGRLSLIAEELAAEAPPAGDLAAGSLDLLGVALALEAAEGIVVSAGVLDEAPTSVDLLRGTPLLEAEEQAGEETAFVWASLGSLERVGWLTPYIAETIAEDALHAGPGARLEVAVAPLTADADLARVRDRFAPLACRGIQVDVHRRGRRDAPAADESGPEQLRLPFRAGPHRAGTRREEAVDEHRGGEQGLRDRAQPPGSGQEPGQQRREVPGNG